MSELVVYIIIQTVSDLRNTLPLRVTQKTYICQMVEMLLAIFK